jgi:hypothetical protein
VRVPSFTLALAVPALVVALPVLSRPVPGPHAVRPVVEEVAVAGVDERAARSLREPGYAAAGPSRGRLAVLTPQRGTRSFALLGVTWAEDRGLGEVGVTVRTRSGGRWGGWEEIDADDDHGPDLGTADISGHRAGTAPMWVGTADGVQLRVTVESGDLPRDVRLSLVDPGRSDADAGLGVSSPLGGSGAAATASTGRPTIITRAQWGADESIRGDAPEYASTLQMGFVHHTVSTNSYSAAQAASLVRGVYAFHVRSRGWSDIGYNFLVDKFGRIYEGRAGGVDRPVIGAHTSGFNTKTFGVSLLGTYTSVVPSSAQLAGLQKILAWKLQAYHRDPVGTTLMTSAGGTRYDKGLVVRLNTISGHREGGQTACPGYQTYIRLPGVRRAVKTLMGANLVEPLVTGAVPLYLSGDTVDVRARGLAPMSWRLRLTSVETGAVVRSIYERSRVTTVAASWDLRDDAGALVLPGRYRAVLDAWNWSGNFSVPYVTEVQVRSPLSSGLAVLGADGTTRVLTGRWSERPSSPLAAVLHGGSSVPARPDQYAPYGPAPARLPDGAYFRTSTGALHVVTGGVRRRLDAATATALKLPTAPAALPDELALQLPTGAALMDVTRHPDGMLVTDGTTTWRLEDGLRRPFSSPTARATWAQGRATARALAGDLALREGPVLGPAEGTLLRRADGSGVVVSGGVLRAVPAASAKALGYAVSTALQAAAADIASMAFGAPVTDTTRHPAGSLVRTSTGYLQVELDRRRPVHGALVTHDSRRALPATPLDATLALATMPAPDGFAALGADDVVRVVSGGRLLSLDAVQAVQLGYAGVPLPRLDPLDLGRLVPARPLTTASHVSGSLVSSPDGTWLLEGGVRRPVTPGILATYRGRVVVPATPADLSLPLAAAAPPAHGTLLETEDGRRWVADRGTRRAVTDVVAARLGLDLLVWLTVPLGDLNGTRTADPLA